MGKECRTTDRSIVQFQGFTVEQIGRRARSTTADFYHYLLATSWARVLLIFVGIYIAANVVFALLYMLWPECLQNARPGSFSDAFFFSIDTMTTIGYGNILPANLYAHVLATTEVLFGLLWVAITTGMLFAKISLPTAKVQFSDDMVICRRDGKPVLMMRLANSRNTAVIEARIRLDLMITEQTQEGEITRKLHPLRMQQDTTPMFVITWNAMHVIDETSPLYGLDADALRTGNARISVITSGVDSALMQTVIAQKVYDWQHILWNHCFVDIISPTSSGMVRVDYTKFSDTREAGEVERFEIPAGARSALRPVDVG